MLLSRLPARTSVLVFAIATETSDTSARLTAVGLNITRPSLHV